MGKIKNLTKGLEDVILNIQQAGAIGTNIHKGYSKPKNADALSDGMFATALGIAKTTTAGKVLLPNSSGKRVTQKLNDDQLEMLQAFGTAQKQEIIAKEADFKKSDAYKADNTIAEPDVLKTLREQNKRTQDMIDTGSFERDQFFTEKALDYYRDPEYGNKRKWATVGAVGAIGLGSRLATGGDLTHNGRGERDIVGIPFI